VLCAGPSVPEQNVDPNSELTVFDLAGTDQGGLLADIVALLVRVCVCVCEGESVFLSACPGC